MLCSGLRLTKGSNFTSLDGLRLILDVHLPLPIAKITVGKSCLQFRSMDANFTVVYNTLTVYGVLKFCVLRLRFSNIWLLCSF